MYYDYDVRFNPVFEYMMLIPYFGSGDCDHNGDYSSRCVLGLKHLGDDHPYYDVDRSFGDCEVDVVVVRR